jgi:predicted acyl esterase
MIKAASMLKVSFIEYIGAVDGHGSDTSGIENNFSSNMDNNWIMYWLNNSHSHLPDSGVFHYASSHYPKINNRWSFTHFSSPVWPPANYSPIILYFHPQGMLSEQPNDSKEDSSGFRNNIIDSSLTMRQAVNISFKGDLFNSAFKKDILKFETEPLSSDLQITGIPN